MAHGVAGILALLSGAMRAGIQVDGHAKAVTELCATFDRYRQGSAACPWWPAMISPASTDGGGRTQDCQARLSRCYGTPGQARAQQLAGLALGDQERMRVAERALAGCVLDRQVAGLLADASLCHGWAGGPDALAGGWRRPRPRPLGAALREARRGMEDHLARAGPPASAGSWKEHPASSSPRTTCPMRAANRPDGTPACC